jgi:hypothetical protein
VNVTPFVTWKEGTMFKAICTLAAAACLVGAPAAASAQDVTTAGAGRVELSAAPLGGLFIVESTDALEPKFRNYALNGTITFNPTRFVGIEGDLGWAIGSKQNVTFAGTRLIDQKTPHLFTYSANLVFHPVGNDHVAVPYVTGGVGGLTMINTTDVESLGILKNERYLMTNIGGGLKLFSSNNWGVRGDYRFLMIRDRDDAPAFFGRQEMRFGHRFSAALIVTY